MRFCVIGVGRFGYHVATRLADNGMDVLAVDSNESIIASIRDKVTQAICLRVNDEEALRNIGVEDMDAVIVAMGENFAQSILVTALLKRNLGIPKVITRSVNHIHRDILLLIGADQVVLPEQEMGIRLADTLSLESSNLTKLSTNFGVTYGNPPKKAIGKTVAHLQTSYKVNCLGKKINEDIIALENTYVIQAGDTLVYAGSLPDLEKVVNS